MWPESVREQLAGTLTPAGVLVPIMNHESELTVLMTQRSAALGRGRRRLVLAL